MKDCKSLVSHADFIAVGIELAQLNYCNCGDTPLRVKRTSNELFYA
jgi:hypothetical protein